MQVVYLRDLVLPVSLNYLLQRFEDKVIYAFAIPEFQR